MRIERDVHVSGFVQDRLELVVDPLVRHHDPHAGAPPDLDGLADGIGPSQHPVPGVGGVAPAGRLHQPGELRQLIGRRGPAGRVVQPGRERDRTGRQPRLGVSPHDPPLVTGGRRRAPARGPEPQREVGHGRHEVERQPAAEPLQVCLRGPGAHRRLVGRTGAVDRERGAPELGRLRRREPGPAEPVGRREVGRHALDQRRPPVVRSQQRRLGVDVRVDEPGAHEPVGRVDDRACGRQGARWLHGDDPVALDRDIGQHGLRPGRAVDDPATADEQVGRHPPSTATRAHRAGRVNPEPP